MKASKTLANEMKDLIIYLLLITIIALCFLLNGCTYSINMAHTSGSATDLIDENQKADADVRPNVSIRPI